MADAKTRFVAPAQFPSPTIPRPTGATHVTGGARHSHAVPALGVGYQTYVTPNQSHARE